ncbi:MAG: carboxypeptidase-like regulatory domain-containing protein, partial [Thermoguttaceae bacterium]|nr:carboxypeptidase-like regulatory domain-containing protein [Thermoguttaceae bacterium]
GNPVEGALVTLVPPEPSRRGAVGRTDASGRFTLTTFEPGDGALPGSYNVAISKVVLEGEAPPETPTETGGVEPDKRVSKDLLPPKYKVAATSGLKAEIQGPGPVELRFELTD